MTIERDSMPRFEDMYVVCFRRGAVFPSVPILEASMLYHLTHCYAQYPTCGPHHKVCALIAYARTEHIPLTELFTVLKTAEERERNPMNEGKTLNAVCREALRGNKIQCGVLGCREHLHTTRNHYAGETSEACKKCGAKEVCKTPA